MSNYRLCFIILGEGLGWTLGAHTVTLKRGTAPPVGYYPSLRCIC